MEGGLQLCFITPILSPDRSPSPSRLRPSEGCQRGLLSGMSGEIKLLSAEKDANFLIANHLRDNGVFISATGPGANILKIRPTPVLQPPESHLFLDAVETAFAAVSAR